MRIDRWLLGGAAFLGLLHAVGTAVRSPILPAAPLLAWVALLGYVLLVARAAGRRALVTVGVALAALALPYLMPWLDSLGEPSRSQFITVAMTRESGGPAVREPAYAEWWWELALLAAGCLALLAVVRSLPARDRGSGRPVGAAVAVLAVSAWAVRGWWLRWHDDPDSWTVAGFVAAALPYALLAGAVLAVAVRAALRGRAGPAVVGLVLLALALLAEPWYVRDAGEWTSNGQPVPALVERVHPVPGWEPVPFSVSASVDESTRLLSVPVLQALTFLGYLAGTALVLVAWQGALARTRAHGAVRPGS